MKKLATITSLFLTLQSLAISPGQKAPSFTLIDQNNKEVTLSNFKGKTVVLEWYNKGCPFVRKHYDSSNMQKSQELAKEKGIVWLSIVSSAEGKQGHLTDASEALSQLNKEKSKASHLLLDTTGSVGKAYGAVTTPQMVLIDKNGIVQYQGAIDSIPSANPADIKDATNYIERAMLANLDGKEIRPSKTKPYGCSVKY
ncbi:redoxin family protein [Halobacteriovorax sp. GB3]|uniref:redoxin family protein n=1 Tax=Halobacteriovorax sp. GB3 TaxID=2719615 RepID=UPI00235F0666|nr:redoxin family protein [Halobacteriovorax sp. GB3]MDD0853302.1 redoxin family protein [Halobacteriovorax sp. GB3]